MPRRRRPSISLKQDLASELDPLAKLWVVRTLVEFKALEGFVDRNYFHDSQLAQGLGLGHWLNYEHEDEFDRKSVFKELKEIYKNIENQANELSCAVDLKQNVARLAQLIGLNDVECRILEFACLLHTERSLGVATDYLGDLSSKQSLLALSGILRLDLEDVREALSSHGALVKAGLVYVEKGMSDTLLRKLSVLSDSFVDALMLPEQKPLDFIRDIVQSSSAPTLDLGHYWHIQKEMDVLLPYIRQAIAKQKSGVNVFIYGPPGTGKSELVKVLAKLFGVTLHEISNQDDDGDSIGGKKRLRAFRAAQCFFARQQTLLLFDEIEDVFDDASDFFGLNSTAKQSKAWLNKALEENPVPTFWLSNSSRMDPAFIRRFDLCIEMPIPHRSQRERILKDNCGDLLDDKHIERFSLAEHLSPAVANKASEVLKGIVADLPAAKVPQAFETIVNNTLMTQGHDKIPKQANSGLPDFYKPDYVNCNLDLAKVLEGIRECGSARLCLFGPPGTGKTAYGRWLAKQLDKPLMLKRASDLLSMWVGGTEENIARAFEEAESEQAVLLIDEVDSFLQDRRGASNSWEVSGVNEMLTQMEAFNGIFIASTNLMDNLDQAALRRFDMKLHFDFMSSDQAVALFRDYATHLNIVIEDEAFMMEIPMIRNLTPGDFAAISRRHRFMPIQNTQEMLDSLIEDCSLKEHSKRAIGFV